MAGLRSSAEEVTFRRHGTSLAMYRPIPELQNFWEDHWGHRPIAAVLADASSGKLGELEGSLISFLPRSGTVLEAGCGTGRVVQALTARGYDVVGVDYAAGTLASVAAAAPYLHVEVGDITELRWPEESFSAYVSIGVMEHFFDGPAPALREAMRVLEPGGIALISVPYLNRPRHRVWRKADDVSTIPLEGDWRFYQDHYRPAEFERLVSDAGFNLVETVPYGLYGALIRDLSLLAWADDHGYLRHRIRAGMKWACARAPLWVRRRYSHMMMFVCEKTAS